MSKSIHIQQLPFFFYGTLKDNDGAFFSEIKPFIVKSRRATIQGSLYYFRFIREAIKSRGEESGAEYMEDITAAYIPTEEDKILGRLYWLDVSKYYDIQARLDNLEFNFDLSEDTADGKATRSGIPKRLYLRNITTATMQVGRIELDRDVGEMFTGIDCYVYAYHSSGGKKLTNRIHPDGGSAEFIRSRKGLPKAIRTERWRALTLALPHEQ